MTDSPLEYVLNSLSPYHQVMEPDDKRFWFSSELLEEARRELAELRGFKSAYEQLTAKMAQQTKERDEEPR